MGRHILRRKTVAASAVWLCMCAAPAYAAPAPLPPHPTDLLAALPASVPWEGSQAYPPLQGHRGEELYELAAPDQDIVDSWVEVYFGKKREWLETVSRRLPLYRRYIEGRIQAMGLPRELLYLPAVESGFQVKATSPRGAAGIWQLMKNTAAGLVMDQWVDERRDFWKATDASLVKLRDDYRRFGDWYLALAAYNCGATRLSGIIKETGISDFWALRKKGKLPKETASFVPQFLSLARILSYPGRYGLRTDWTPSVAWARLAVGGSIDVRTLCREAGMPYEVISSGNGELTTSITPPASYRYSLKVPIEYQEAVEGVLTRSDRRLLEFRIHRVREGDTLSEIAQMYGIPMEMIVEFNPSVKPLALRIGSQILVPVKGKSG